jgi:hypothetical protein
MVVPYDDSLLNWPQGKSLTPSPDLLRLAYYRAAYATLANTVADLVENPQAAEFTHVLGRYQEKGAGDQSSLSVLQTDIQTATYAVTQLYKVCNGWKVDNATSACATNDALVNAIETGLTDPYEFMTRLPLQMATRQDAFLPGDQLAEALFQQNLVFARNGYCEQARLQGLPHPACLSEPDLREKYLKGLRANVADIWYPAPGGYQFRSLYRRDATCLTAHEKGDKDTVLFMRGCESEVQKAKQRFNWQRTGQLTIRKGECVAGPVKKNAGVSPHSCVSKEGQQMWRFIPLKRDANSAKPGTPGLLQEAGYGRCLNFGTPSKGKLTYVVTTDCNLDDGKQHWTFAPK